MTAYEGVKRTGPPVAVQKLRESFYMVQVTLSEPPSADWKRLFYDTQGAGVPADFPAALGGNHWRTAEVSLRSRRR